MLTFHWISIGTDMCVNWDGHASTDMDDALEFTDRDEADAEAAHWRGKGYEAEVETSQRPARRAQA